MLCNLSTGSARWADVRNGWGSLVLEGDGLKGLDALTQSNPLLNELARPLDQCLQLDWPHALGRGADGRLLIWTSKQPLATWRDAMVELARVKIEFRAKNKLLQFTRNGEDPQARKQDLAPILFR